MRLCNYQFYLLILPARLFNSAQPFSFELILFIYSLFIVDSFTIEHIHIKKRLAVHKGKPLVTLIEVNTKCAYLEAH